MKYVPGMYFRNAEEASEWLEFDCSDEDAERAFYAENDRYVEWQLWQKAANEGSITLGDG